MNCVVYVPECHYAYRMNPASLTHQYSREKYQRNYKFFEIVETKLAGILPKEKYELHLLRSQMLYLRNSISGFVHNNGNVKDDVRYVLNDKFWKRLFSLYPFKRLPLKQRVYYTLAKLKSPTLMIILAKLK